MPKSNNRRKNGKKGKKMPITNSGGKIKMLYGIMFLDGSERFVICPDYKLEEWKSYCKANDIPCQIKRI